MSKKIDDWIHGKLVIETDDLDRLVVKGPVQPDGYQRSVLIGMTPEEMAYLNYKIPRKGPQRNALLRGASRALKALGIVGGTALITGAGMMIKGVPWTIALPAALATAAGSALVAGVNKTGKEYRKQNGAVAAPWWQVLGGIILEVLKLVRELMRKGKK